MTVVGPYLDSKGVTLDLKTAGQKCPRVEVAIRSLKDTARAMYCGIQNSEGYLLPAGYLRQLLLVDAPKTLNRRVRRNEVRSPFELFTGKETDHARDFRAPFGAVVAAFRPQRGVGRDTSMISPEAEIGIVAVRPMDGTSVVGIYLPAKRSIIYTVKFERIRATEWLLHDLKTHVSTDGIECEEGNGRTTNSHRISAKEGGAGGVRSDGDASEDEDYTPYGEDDSSSDSSEGSYISILSGSIVVRATSLLVTHLLLGKGQLLFVSEVTSQKKDTSSGSNQAPSGVNWEIDPAHSESPSQ